MRNIRWLPLLTMLLVLAACVAPGGAPAAGGSSETDGGEGSADLTPVRLQLQWVTQSQFAGYYA
ncbi:MAG: hypothetical protein KDE31_07540, partial [Caldilineaceae bacterium]|nr:hypothetical protein [Caldilineaceae bacterium]